MTGLTSDQVTGMLALPDPASGGTIAQAGDVVAVSRPGENTPLQKATLLGSGSVAGVPAFQVTLSRNVTFADSQPYNLSATEMVIPFDGTDGIFGGAAGFDPQGVFNFAFAAPAGAHPPSVIPAFICPVTGIYQFWASVYCNPATTSGDLLNLQLLLQAFPENGVGGSYQALSSNGLLPQIIDSAGNWPFTMSVAGAMPLTKGDFVRADMLINAGPNGANMQINGFGTQFGGMRIQ